MHKKQEQRSSEIHKIARDSKYEDDRMSERFFDNQQYQYPVFDNEDITDYQNYIMKLCKQFPLSDCFKIIYIS